MPDSIPPTYVHSIPTISNSGQIHITAGLNNYIFVLVMPSTFTILLFFMCHYVARVMTVSWHINIPVFTSTIGYSITSPSLAHIACG